MKNIDILYFDFFQVQKKKKINKLSETTHKIYNQSTLLITYDISVFYIYIQNKTIYSTSIHIIVKLIH